MIKFETQNEERERRKREREREWHLFMDEISLLQDKLNTFKQRKTNIQNIDNKNFNVLLNLLFDHYLN